MFDPATVFVDVRDILDLDVTQRASVWAEQAPVADAKSILPETDIYSMCHCALLQTHIS